MKSLPINWFDFVVIALIFFGFFRGRKRGMSEEVLPLLQTLLMVVVAGHFYEPLGKMFAQATGVFSLLFAYIATYLAIIVIMKMLFAPIKKVVDEKIFGSDFFARMEYYFGTLSGGIRYVCLVIMFLALMNAHAINQKELDAQLKKDKDLYGSNFFPSFGEIQQAVMDKSTTGKFAREHLAQWLIKPTSAESKPLQKREGPGRMLERNIDEVIDK